MILSDCLSSTSFDLLIVAFTKANLDSKYMDYRKVTENINLMVEKIFESLSLQISIDRSQSYYVKPATFLLEFKDPTNLWKRMKADPLMDTWTISPPFIRLERSKELLALRIKLCFFRLYQGAQIREQPPSLFSSYRVPDHESFNPLDCVKAPAVQRGPRDQNFRGRGLLSLFGIKKEELRPRVQERNFPTTSYALFLAREKRAAQQIFFAEAIALCSLHTHLMEWGYSVNKKQRPGDLAVYFNDDTGLPCHVGYCLPDKLIASKWHATVPPYEHALFDCPFFDKPVVFFRQENP